MTPSAKGLVPFCGIIDPEWVIYNGPDSLFDNPAAIQIRSSKVPLEAQVLVEEALRYMFLSDGQPTSPILYPNRHRKARLALLRRYFTLGELHVFTFLTNRTKAYSLDVPDTGEIAVTKSLRKNLGVRALRRMQRAQFRCEACGMPHVQTLNVDHVNGIKNDRVALRVLCGNCHLLKSHEDKFGNLKPEPLDAP